MMVVAVLDRIAADAVLLPEHAIGQPDWSGVSMKLIEKIPAFRIGPPSYCSPQLVSAVTRKLDRAATQLASSLSASI